MWLLFDNYLEQMETIMHYVNYKLIQLFICAKVDNLGNVLCQLNEIPHRSQENATDRNSAGRTEVSYQRLSMRWPTMVIVAHYRGI